MRTYELLDDEGRLYAFEVNNTGLGRNRFCRVVENVPGARIVRRPKFLSWFREEVFCEFDVDGVTYIGWEPYGDNSRFWVGPEPTAWHPQTELVRESFEAFRESRVLRGAGFFVGALMMGFGIFLFTGASEASDVFQAFLPFILGAYFMHFALTGERSIVAHWRRS